MEHLEDAVDLMLGTTLPYQDGLSHQSDDMNHARKWGHSLHFPLSDPNPIYGNFAPGLFDTVNQIFEPTGRLRMIVLATGCGIAETRTDIAVPVDNC